MSGWNRSGFFTTAMKRFVINGSEHMDSCFAEAFFQLQHASFPGWYGGCTVAGGGNVT